MIEPDFQTKAFTFMMRLWLWGAILCALCSAYFLIFPRDRSSALFFFGVFIFSCVQYVMRRRQRKKHLEYLEYKRQGGNKKTTGSKET